MDTDYVLTYVCCALLVGLGGWLFYHTVDRRVHFNERTKMISEELLAVKLQGLEDRLVGRIAAVNVKLEALEQWTRHINRRLEKMSEND
jgi:hypothetical protein